MISDLFLSDAGFLFFTFWTLLLGVVSFSAFGRDLFPTKVSIPAPALTVERQRR